MATVDTLTASPGASPKPRLSGARIVGFVILALGAVSALYRLVRGLGAATNLNDGYPWGLWISFDVMSGVALAAGGFTISAIVYVFNLKQYYPLLRPAKLSAFIGYVLVVLGIFFDLGQPWRIWHTMVMWNTGSVLFEISLCVMVYTSVLGVDVAMMVLEATKQDRWVARLKRVYVVLVVLGLVLSTLHQSSLGALFLLLPQKMSDLWASKAVGPLFYASAVVAGLSVIILESLVSARAHRREPEMKLLPAMGKMLGVALLVYFAMKVTDLFARGVEVWQLDVPHLFFYLELFGTVALPALLLSFRGVRESRGGLLAVTSVTAFGVALNRFNVSLTGYTGNDGFSYFPSLAELSVTAALIVLAIMAFDLGTRFLPVYSPTRSAPRGEAGRETHARA